MAEKTAGVSSFNWWLPSRAGFLAFVASVAVAVCQADTALLLYLFFGLILIVFSIALLAYTAFGKDRRKRLTLLSTLAAVWAVAVSVFAYQGQVRKTARWFVWSHTYKEKVLAQQAPANGELRHLEWDGWGWGGQDTTVYLVLDPQDSLSLAAASHQSGKFAGIPCEVPKVSRLESQWYAVTFYTNQEWSRCN